MKFLLLLSLTSLSVFAASSSFTCTGDANGNEDELVVSVKAQSQTQLKDVQLTWQGKTKIRLPLVDNDENYTPKSPLYKNLKKFVVDAPNGGACKWTLLIPAVENRAAKFKAYSQTACDSYYETIHLECVSR